MKRFGLTWAGLCVCAFICAACGDDDVAADSGPDASGGDAAADAASSDMIPPSMSGSGGSTQTMSSTPAVMCGQRRCAVPLQMEYNLLAGFAQTAGFPLPSGGGGLLPQACCTSDMECGLVVAGAGCVPPPPADAHCPNVSVLSVTVPGCCIESQGICGANGAQTGQGCVDVSVLGPLLGLPAPRRCGMRQMPPGTDAIHTTPVTTRQSVDRFRRRRPRRRRAVYSDPESEFRIRTGHGHGHGHGHRLSSAGTRACNRHPCARGTACCRPDRPANRRRSGTRCSASTGHWRRRRCRSRSARSACRRRTSRYPSPSI